VRRPQRVGASQRPVRRPRRSRGCPVPADETRPRSPRRPRAVRRAPGPGPVPRSRAEPRGYRTGAGSACRAGLVRAGHNLAAGCGQPEAVSVLGTPAHANGLAAISEPYWDALAEAAFQRRFHRPRSYLHPQTSSLDHLHRLLTALLRRRKAATSTLLAQLLGVTRTNLSNQFQDGHRILDLHRIAITPIPGLPHALSSNCKPALGLPRTAPQIHSDSYSITGPRGAGVLPLHTDRMRALLHVARLVDDQHRPSSCRCSTT
jgi:hypothetical protein